MIAKLNPATKEYPNSGRTSQSQAQQPLEIANKPTEIVDKPKEIVDTFPEMMNKHQEIVDKSQEIANKPQTYPTQSMNQSGGRQDGPAYVVVTPPVDASPGLIVNNPNTCSCCCCNCPVWIGVLICAIVSIPESFSHSLSLPLSMPKRYFINLYDTSLHTNLFISPRTDHSFTRY